MMEGLEEDQDTAQSPGYQQPADIWRCFSGGIENECDTSHTAIL